MLLRFQNFTPTWDIRKGSLPNNVLMEISAKVQNVCTWEEMGKEKDTPPHTYQLTGIVAIFFFFLALSSKAWKPWVQAFVWCLLCFFHFLSYAFGFDGTFIAFFLLLASYCSESASNIREVYGKGKLSSLIRYKNVSSKAFIKPLSGFGTVWGLCGWGLKGTWVVSWGSLIYLLVSHSFPNCLDHC